MHAPSSPLTPLLPPQDHNEPALDALALDVANYADLRSFQLQLNRQFIAVRLPLREGRTGLSGVPGGCGVLCCGALACVVTTRLGTRHTRACT
jgi:hypothetical protein